MRMAPAGTAFMKHESANESKYEHTAMMVKPQQQRKQEMLPVPHDLAQKRPFPPGCPVIYIDPAGKDVTMSRVESVFVYLTSANIPSFIYRLQKDDLLVKETHLQYAPSCPVWAFHGNSWFPSVVWNSYQELPLSEPRYSVQQVPSGALYHGISREYIGYREDYSKPVMDNAKAFTNVDNGRVNVHIPNEPKRHFAANQHSRTSSNDSSSQETLERKRYSKRKTTHRVSTNKAHKSRRRLTRDQQSRTNRVSFSPEAPLERKRSFAYDDANMNCYDIAKRFKSRASDSKRTNHEPSNQEERDCRSTHRDDPARDTRDDSRSSHRSDQARETRDDPNAITSFFFVPRMGIFTDDEIKDFDDQNVNSVMCKTKCTIRFCSANNDQCSRFELTGTKEQIAKASDEMEYRLVDSISQHNASLALYYLALWNSHRRSNDEVCLQYCRQQSRGKAYMYAKILPKKESTLFPRAVIGRGGERKRRIEKETRCSLIFVNNKSDITYYLISGDTAHDVKECKQEVQRELDDAVKKGKNGY